MERLTASNDHRESEFNQYRRIRVTPISGPIGAEVECDDLLCADQETQGEIVRAWRDHLVLLFRGRKLSDEELLRLGRYFGDLEQSPPTSVDTHAVRPNPYISIISNIVEDGVAIGSLGNDEAIWHTDMSNRPVPPAASILTAWEVPPTGGETGFINMYEALEDLPGELLKQIEGKMIYHDGGHNSAGVARRNSVSSSHPIIRTHPETNRNALYLGRRRNSRIDGLRTDESDALLDALWAHTTESREAWHHSWRVGDTLVWDNRCVIHHRNGFDGEARRLMHRTQTQGTPPFFSREAVSRGHPRSRLALSVTE